MEVYNGSFIKHLAFWVKISVHDFDFYAPAIRRMVERAYSVTCTPVHPFVRLLPRPALEICVEVFQAGAPVSFGRISVFFLLFP